MSGTRHKGMSRTYSLPKMFSAGAVWLAALTLIASGCGPVIFKLDETRASGACQWSEDNSGIACVSDRHSREPRRLLLYVPGTHGTTGRYLNLISEMPLHYRGEEKRGITAGGF
jgi:hypothetical protein